MMLFDLPVKASALRIRLRRFLLQHDFGYLQQSVWISPDSLAAVRQQLGKLPVEVESLTLFEGRPCGGEADVAIVLGAWDFSAINTGYERHQTILAQCPGALSRQLVLQPAFRAWARREREAWTAAVRKDPLLPRTLHPTGYLGQRSWEARREFFRLLQRGWAR